MHYPWKALIMLLELSKNTKTSMLARQLQLTLQELLVVLVVELVQESLDLAVIQGVLFEDCCLASPELLEGAFLARVKYPEFPVML